MESNPDEMAHIPKLLAITFEFLKARERLACRRRHRIVKFTTEFRTLADSLFALLVAEAIYLH